MCFKTNILSRKKIAGNDITCYKVVQASFTRGAYDSLYQYYTYETNKENSERDLIKYKLGDEALSHECVNYLEFMWRKFFVREIYWGYHSYKTENYADSITRGLLDRKNIVKTFIIPKGSEYYENEFEYVSNKIILI